MRRRVSVDFQSIYSLSILNITLNQLAVLHRKRYRNKRTKDHVILLQTTTFVWISFCIYYDNNKCMGDDNKCGDDN